MASVFALRAPMKGIIKIWKSWLGHGETKSSGTAHNPSVNPLGVAAEKNPNENQQVIPPLSTSTPSEFSPLVSSSGEPALAVFEEVEARQSSIEATSQSEDNRLLKPPENLVVETDAITEAPVSGSPLSIAFNLPKIQGKGEDADPVFAWQEQSGFLAVFDGMGGSGSTTYHHNGQNYTGAFIASRLVANEMRGLFGGIYPFPAFPLDAAPLTERLVAALQRELTSLERGMEPTRLKSKMIRRLPTTMAALFVENKGESVQCQTLWAGDSRCYALSPEQGLQQLTRDDLKAKGDALENLKDDSPLSNCLHADGECEIRSQVVTLPLPCLLLAATDGCFGYLLSPAHFEFLLLDSLMSSADTNSWQKEITSRLQAVSGDDCSMALFSIGWSSHQAMQAAFSSRHQRLEQDFIAPLDRLSRTISQDASLLKEIEARKIATEQQRDQLRQELWKRYKPAYDAFLDSITEDKGGATT